jgi:hypothetical protein
MRRSLALLPFAALTIAAVIVAACEDATLEAPSLQLPDGALADVTTAPYDAAPQPDAGQPDAAPLPVTVNVIGAAGPKSGVLVVFHDATGAVLESKETGADGKATSTGAIPAMASALIAGGTNRDIMTWTGVEPGDELLYRDPHDFPLIGMFDVTLPPFSLDVGASPTSYTAYTGDCGNFSESLTLSYALNADCLNARNAVLGSASDAFGNRLGYSTKKGQLASADGGAVAIATDPWAAPANVDVTIANAPAPFSQLTLTQIADGAGFRSDYDREITNGSAFKVALGFADALQANAFANNNQSGSWRGIAKRVSPSSAIALDFATALPELTGSNLVATDARRPVITWTAAGSTAGADGGIVRVRFLGPEDANYEWTIVVPPGQTSVTAPAMPNSAASFLPDADAGAGIFTVETIGFAESDLLNGYAPFRRQQGRVNLVPVYSSMPPLPLDGNARVTVLGLPRR